MFQAIITTILSTTITSLLLNPVTAGITIVAAIATGKKLYDYLKPKIIDGIDSVDHWLSRQRELFLDTVYGPEYKGRGERIFDAIWDKDIDQIEYLFRKGLNVNYEGKINRVTPLAYAMQIKNKEIFELVLNHKPNLDWKNNPLSETLLYKYITKKEYSEFVETLLENDANPNTTAQFNRTPMHKIASKLCNENIDKEHLLKTAELLLKEEYKTDIDAQDKYGNTPLHLIAEAGNEEIFDWFVEKGANKHAVNNQRQTPQSILESAQSKKLNSKKIAEKHKEKLGWEI
ncbi:MAG: putative proteasome non-ATPase regulatory subunit [Burkholderiales bacterium]|jgi:ankyrin repeat protein|nr:putative proteasome non-ATPase regulatory subunit [Burkholderiales bacterium]